MKLYIYDHCPYCVRARMIFGLKKVSVELHVFLSDDFKSPESMIGEKMAPILQKEDGGYMPESLDIVNYIDNHYAGQPILTGQLSSEIAKIIKEIEDNDYQLTYPRYVKMGLPEFATQGAIDYFVTKKTPRSGAFDECLAQTDQLVSVMSTILNKLEPLITSSEACNGSLSVDDICLFPILRNLTCVKTLQFPPKIKAYIESMARLSNVNLYFDSAM